MAMDVIARRGTKKYCRTRKVLRITPAACGNPLDNLAVANGVAAERGGVVRNHVIRSNRVHVDPFRRPFVPECLRELGHAAFGCSVRRHEDNAPERKPRSDGYEFFLVSPPEQPLSN